MKKSEIIEKLEKLNELDADLEFPHEDCRKISNKENSSENIKEDLHTFYFSLWSLSATNKFSSLSNEELEKYKSWLEKSFFERFPKYISTKHYITPKFTPNLFETLEINEERRKLLFKLISIELKNKNQQNFR